MKQKKGQEARNDELLTGLEYLLIASFLKATIRVINYNSTPSRIRPERD
jgi:hypothetical protein